MNGLQKIEEYRNIYQFLCEHKETIRNELKRKDNSMDRNSFLKNKVQDIEDSIKFVGSIIKELKENENERYKD